MPRFRIADEKPAKLDCVLTAARLITNAILTAPLAGGVPQVEVELVYGDEELEAIANKTLELAKKNPAWERIFKYESVMVRESDAILFIGNYRAHTTPFDLECGLCSGEKGCKYFYEERKKRNPSATETPIKGPVCAFRASDTGYAIGSALWLASRLFIDAKASFAVGLAGKELGYLPTCEIIVAVMLAARSKNPFVDIPPDYDKLWMGYAVDATKKTYITARQLFQHDYRVKTIKGE